MKKYSVILSDIAKEQINDTLDYIADILLNPQAVRNYIISFEKACDDLSVFPEAYPILDERGLEGKGIRKKSIEFTIAYYWVDKNTKIVNIIAILNKRMNQVIQLQKII